MYGNTRERGFRGAARSVVAKMAPERVMILEQANLVEKQSRSLSGERDGEVEESTLPLGKAEIIIMPEGREVD